MVVSQLHSTRDRQAVSTFLPYSILRNLFYLTVLPCVNDGNIELCNQNCNDSHHTIVIKNGTETRNICLLRASRLPWIIDIIKLACKNDPSVNVWLKPGTGKQSGKLYLRYNHQGADFVLIFSAEKHFYRLISAFPVFYTNEKRILIKITRNMLAHISIHNEKRLPECDNLGLLLQHGK